MASKFREKVRHLKICASALSLLIMVFLFIAFLLPWYTYTYQENFKTFTGIQNASNYFTRFVFVISSDIYM